MKIKGKILFLSMLSTTLLLQSCITKRVDEKVDIKDINIESFSINNILENTADFDFTFNHLLNIKNIEILYTKKNNNSEFVFRKIINENTKSVFIKLSNLQPYTEYEIRKIKVITNIEKEITFDINKIFKTKANRNIENFSLVQEDSEFVDKVKLKIVASKENIEYENLELNIDYSLANETKLLSLKTTVNKNNIVYLDVIPNVDYIIRKISLSKDNSIIWRTERELEIKNSFKIASFALNKENKLLNLALKAENLNLSGQKVKFKFIDASEADAFEIEKEFNDEISVSLINQKQESKTYKLSEILISKNGNWKSVKNFIDHELIFSLFDGVEIGNIKLLNNTESFLKKSIEVEFNQISSEYLGKEFKAIIIDDEGNKVYSSPITISKDISNFTFDFSNLKAATRYTLKNIEIFNEGQWINLLVNNSLNFYFETEQDYKQFSGLYHFENANVISYEDINVIDCGLTKFDLNKLKSDLNYSSYFEALNSQVEDVKSSDTISNYLFKSKDNIDIHNILIEDNNIKISLSNPDVEIKKISFMVKSYDEHNQWTKLVEGHKENSEFIIPISQLDPRINQYIITDFIINDEYLTRLDFSEKYIAKINKNIDFGVRDFKVYKDEDAKLLKGSIAFDFNAEDAKLLKDKVFVLVFKTEEKKFVPKLDVFGQIINESENFNKENQINNIKKVYLNFEDLAEFNMSNFQEKLVYKLVAIDVLNKGSYTEFLNRKQINSDFKFSFNFNWKPNFVLSDQLESETIGEDKIKISAANLKENANKVSGYDSIDFSVQNLQSLLVYNFETFYEKKRNEHKSRPESKKYTIKKDNVIQSLHWFRPREILEKTVFKVDQNKSTAEVSKNLNSIVGLNNINDEDVILWFVFELDVNPAKLNAINEFNTPFSRAIIPVSLKHIREKRNINDVKFYLDYKAENSEFQVDIAKKVMCNVRFDLSLDNSNNLKLSVLSRNGAKINNLIWNHNNSNERSIYLNTAQFIVNWIQDKSITTPKLSYLETEKTDNNTIESTSVISRDTYELVNDIKLGSEARRLFKGDKSKGIEEARSRAYSLSALSDGTWNVIAKVNEDPADYRFWVSANYHVWNTRRQDDNWTKSITKEGREMIVAKNAQLVSPTLIEHGPGLSIEPIYRKHESYPDIEATGNLFILDNMNSIDKITYTLMYNFKENIHNSGVDKYYNNIGEIENPNKNNVLDVAFVIADFSPIFKEFEGKDLNTYRKANGEPLQDKEKKSIEHFLSFKKLKPLQKSELNYFSNSDSNLNLYIGSIPKGYTKNEHGRVQGARYREYIYGNNRRPIGVTAGEDMDSYVFESEVAYTDLANGSSGSMVYDSEGKLFGMNVQGSATSYNSFLILDNRLNSYFGSAQTIYNPNTFYSKIKKLSYLYPDKYFDIFKEQKS